MREDVLDRTVGELAFSAIDFESAGAAVGLTDVPVQIGIAGGGLLKEAPDFWVSYIATTRPIHWQAAQVHGITKERLADAPEFASLWGDINALLRGRVIVGHNLGTERKFLNSFVGHGFGPWLDTLPLAKMCLPRLTDYSLATVADALQVTPQVKQFLPNKDWHDALFDATASLMVLHQFCNKLNLFSEQLRVFDKAVKA